MDTYLLALATAEITQARVDAIKTKILSERKYYVAAEYREVDEPERITEPKYAWMMPEPEFLDFLVLVKAALRAAGFNIQQGIDDAEYSFCCPAGKARQLLLQAGDAVIYEGAAMLNERNPDEVLNDLNCAAISKRAKFINLLVKLVVNLPGYHKPDIRKELCHA